MDNPTLLKSSSLRGAFAASITMSFAGLGDALLYPILPVYGKNLGFSVIAIGMLLSINRFVRIIANTYIANLVRRMGAKKILLATSLLASITTYLYGIEWGFLLFFIARILWGLCYSGLKIATLDIASKSGKHTGLAFGLSQGIKNLGPLLVLWLGPLLIETFDTSLSFTLVAITSSLGVLFALTIPTNTATTAIKKQTVVTSKATFRCTPVNLLVFMLAISVDGVLVVTLAQLFQTNTTNSIDLLSTIALYLLFKKIGTIVFSIVGGYISLHFSATHLFYYAAIGCILGLIFIGLGYLTTGILLSFVLNPVVVSFGPVMAIKTTGNALQAISSTSTWWDLGAALGALLGIYLLNHLGIPLLYVSLGVLSGIVFLNFHRHYATTSSSTL